MITINDISVIYVTAHLSVRIIKKYLCIYLFASHTDALDDSVTRSTDTSFFFF